MKATFSCSPIHKGSPQRVALYVGAVFFYALSDAIPKGSESPPSIELGIFWLLGKCVKYDSCSHQLVLINQNENLSFILFKFVCVKNIFQKLN